MISKWTRQVQAGAAIISAGAANESLGASSVPHLTFNAPLVVARLHDHKAELLVYFIYYYIVFWLITIPQVVRISIPNLPLGAAYHTSFPPHPPGVL